MPRLGAAFLSALSLCVALLTGCVHAPLNRPLLTGGQPPVDYRFTPRNPDGRRDDLFIVVFFSGGGMRASAFSYGVLRAMHETVIPVRGEPREFLSQVDLISAVSGGSLTAAYYCLNGGDTFDTFERKVLWRNIPGALALRCSRPDNLVRMASPYYGRSDLAAEFYDRHIFNHSTFGDLARRKGRPFLVINATDVESGTRFAFTQTYFDLIGSDLSSYPIARAVAASSAVPLLLSPITLRNYAGQSPPQLPMDDPQNELMTRLRRLVEDLQLYSGPDRHKFLHLVDGGVSDNLGLRAVQEYVMLHGGLERTLNSLNDAKVTKYAIIVVDASTPNSDHGVSTEAVPGIFRVLRDTTKVLLGRENYETTQLFEQSIKLWQLQMRSEGRRSALEIYRINLNFSNLGDTALTAYCNQLGTGYGISRAEAERVRDAGMVALRNNSEFRRLVCDLASEKDATFSEQPGSKGLEGTVPSALEK